jgi:hypothetical protein
MTTARWLVRGVDVVNRQGKSVGVRRVRYTGKSPHDSPWAGAIDALGGLSLGLYPRLSRWKREAALRHPEESTGFQVLARRRP